MSTRVRVAAVASPGARIALDEATRHHLTTVLRLGVGATVELVDGQGDLFEATLAEMEPSLVLAVGERLVHAAANPAVAVEMWLPVLKGGRTDDLVRQLTEVGVSTIVPYVSRRSVVKLDDAKAAKRVRRWQSISDEATRQCRRTDRVTVAPLARQMPSSGPGVFFYEAGTRSLSDALTGLTDEPVRVLVGPEGGLAPDDVALDALVGAGPDRARLLLHRVLSNILHRPENPIRI